MANDLAEREAARREKQKERQIRMRQRVEERGGSQVGAFLGPKSTRALEAMRRDLKMPIREIFERLLMHRSARQHVMDSNGEAEGET
jgi:hypothetical protein